MIKEPKVKEFEAEVAYEPYEGRHLKIVYRNMALTEPTAATGAWYARDIEAYVDSLVEREGWTIQDCHILGRLKGAAHAGDQVEEVLELVFILTK